MPTLAEYNRRLHFARQAFQEAGFDTSCNMRKVIDHFYDQPGIDPGKFRRNRGVFHEAMHVCANALTGSSESEKKASVYERVFMRGGWGNHNLDNEALFDTPLPVPGKESVHTATNFRVALGSAFAGKPKSVDREDSDMLYDVAVQDEKFFRSITGGRALYQLTADEMMTMPIAYFGIKKSPNDRGFSIDRIEDHQRHFILQRIDALEAQYKISGQNHDF